MSWLPGGFNEGDLLFVGDWSRGAVVLFVTLAVGVLVLTWLDVRELRRGRAATLVGLRACTLAVATNSSRRPAGATANGDGTVVAGGAVVGGIAVVGVGGVVGGIAVVVVT